METNFNFKSQPCTSIEQSERLLALGLKKETADMVHFFSQSLAQDWTIVPLAATETAKNIEGVEIPAWSLHRMIEMMPKCVRAHSCGDDSPRLHPYVPSLTIWEWLLRTLMRYLPISISILICLTTSLTASNG